MPPDLADILHGLRFDALLRQAETIRDHPAGADRTDFAMTAVREARLLRTLGTISQREEYRIFTILHFVMPSDAPAEGEHPPADSLGGDDGQTGDEIVTEGCPLHGCKACDDGGRMEPLLP